MPKKPEAKPSKRDQLSIAAELVEHRIFLIRGQKIMLDIDVAELYQVPTKVFNQAVKRNLGRFPSDFMFRLCAEEMELLNRSQIVTGSQKHRDPRYLPYAFTEHGVAMLSAVLRSDRAVQMSILIVRAFVKLREMLATHKELACKMEELERQQKEHGRQLAAVYSIVKKLIDTPVKPQKPIGFKTE
jgi:phage regulator Rha-like protein